MVDPLEIERFCKLIPMRGLVADDLAALGHVLSGETYAFSFVLNNACQRAAVALRQSDDAAPITCPMLPEARIDAIGARVGRTHVPSNM